MKLWRKVGYLAFCFYLCLICVEAILDVTMVIESPFAGFNDEATLKCVSENQYFDDGQFPFAVEANVGTGTDLTSDRKYSSIKPQSWPGKQLTFLPTASSSKFGFISCTVRNNAGDDTTKVTGVIVSQAALVIPTKLNYRASINESMTMSVIQPRRRRISDLYWFLVKNGSTTRAARASLRLQIEQASEENAGFYMVFHQVRDKRVRVFQQALTRLIIRGCREGRFGGDCLSLCPKCENGGVCSDIGGTCICPPGFMGELCETPCGGNRFGSSCQHSCSDDSDDSAECKNKLFCLPDPYGCSCATGYAGILCSYDCVGGTYGADCSEPCHCIDNQCDKFTGNCTIGCSEGWTGSYCRTPCVNGTYGRDCNETCGFCSGDSAVCDRFTGFCPESASNATSSIHVGVNSSFCFFGYRPPLCKEGCSNGTWGLDCKKSCHCLNNTACDVETGYCEFSIDDAGGIPLCEDGWRGGACNESCENGFYGKNCAIECGQCKDNEPCHHIAGGCVSTRGECDPGYLGWKCDEECDVGYFGKRCAFVCNCANGTGCDVETGGCDGFCQAGFTGENCHEPCPFETYGLNCSRKCGNCSPVSQRQKIPLCHPRSGKCTAGCKKAWGGDKCLDGILCDQNPCFNDGTCVQSGDYFSCKCSMLYSGSYCEVRKPPCASSPCLNGGNCTEINSINYTCTCDEYFEGEHCEIDSREVDEPEEEENVNDDDNDELTNHEDDNSEDLTDKDSNDANEDKRDGDDAGERDGTNDSSMLIIVAMCLGVLLTIVLIAFAYKVCYDSQPSVVEPASIAPYDAPLPPPNAERAKPPTPSLAPSSNPSTGSNRGPSMIERDSRTPGTSDLEIASGKLPTLNNRLKQVGEEDIIDKSVDQESCITTSTDDSPLNMSQADSSVFTDSPITDSPINSSSMGGPPDFNRMNHEIETEINPFKNRGNIQFSKPPTPPSFPPETMFTQPITSPQKRKVSRRKVQLRFSKSSLDRLDKITRQNFRNNPNQNGIEPEDKKPSNNEEKSEQNYPKKNKMNARKQNPTPNVYGVAQRDAGLMITTPRNADEEFEMESRKGPILERGGPSKSVLIETK